MSSLRQKIKENKLWPHVKRNWISAIKSMRKSYGGIRKGVFAIEHHSTQCSVTRDDTGFLDGFLSDSLTEEQETEIAENIYDWWISGKKYEQWYAEKFIQQSFNFENE